MPDHLRDSASATIAPKLPLDAVLLGFQSLSVRSVQLTVEAGIARIRLNSRSDGLPALRGVWVERFSVHAAQHEREGGVNKKKFSERTSTRRFSRRHSKSATGCGSAHNPRRCSRASAFRCCELSRFVVLHVTQAKPLATTPALRNVTQRTYGKRGSPPRVNLRG